MKKNGFTLIELLGVIVVIAVLSLIIFPIVMNQFRKNRKQISDTMKTMMIDATSLYVDADPNEYIKNNGNIYCISLEQIVNAGYLSNPLMDLSTGEEIPMSNKMKVSVENLQFHYEYIADDNCVESKVS